jgi:hypothetical protein
VNKLNRLTTQDKSCKRIVAGPWSNAARLFFALWYLLGSLSHVWFVGAKSFTGSPHDGHTLAEQLKQNKLPQAPRSFLAHSSVPRHERMERVARHARPGSSQYSIPSCLRITLFRID